MKKKKVPAIEGWVGEKLGTLGREGDNSEGMSIRILYTRNSRQFY